MPVFVYKAKRDNAQTVTGEVVAADVNEAIELVSRQGLLPVSVSEKTDMPVIHARNGAVDPRVVFAFTRQLVSLLNSGVPLLQALEVLGRQTRQISFTVIVRDVVSNLRNGRAFSACIREHPSAFSDIYVALVKAGEESGRLKELLASLVVYHRKQEEIASKVRGALVYPLFMLAVGVATVMFILGFVMPKIAVLFDGLRMTLPWPTQVVMALSRILRYAWPVIFIFVFLGVLASRFLAQTPLTRRRIHSFLSGLPVIRDFSIKTDLERFSRTLGLLLESGLPILTALEGTVRVLDFEPLRLELLSAQERVTGGASFGECLRESVNIPDIVAQLIIVGEESGNLPGALRDIADTYEQEIAETTRAVTTLLEPLLILVVGLVVGFIVFAMLLPVFQMDMFAQ